MKLKKMLRILFGLVLFLVINGCADTPLSLEPACEDKFETNIVLDKGYLGFCSHVHENRPVTPNPQPMVVEITIDGLSLDNRQVSTSFIDNKSFNTDNNNDNTLYESDRTFKVNIPRCGSYAISVLVRGADNSCFICCNGSTTTIPSAKACTNSNKGAPRFRTVNTSINANLKNPPPSRIELKPTPENCTRCGC